MKAHLTATALCTLLMALSAAAQQDQPRSTALSRATSDLEKLGRQSQFQELAGSAVPEMKAQLPDAQSMLQSASASPNGQPSSTGTVTDPNKMSE